MPSNPVERVRVLFEADTASFSSNVKKAQRDATNYGKTIRKEVVDSGKQINQSFRGAASGIAVIDGPLGGVASRVSAVNSLVSSGAARWTILGASIAGVVAATYKSITAFAEVERQQLKTEQLIRATGFAAGLTAQQLDEQARAVARSTLATTEGIRNAQQVLLTFRTVQGDQFRDTIGLAQDLAAVMGTDAKSAALQLGKALEDPNTGLTALRRSGVSFTETEREMIKALFDAGNAAEGQRLILEKLRLQIGGAGAAEAGGLIGSVDTLSQSYQEFFERIGRNSGLSKFFTDFLKDTATGLDIIALKIAPDEYQQLGLQLTELNQEYTRLTTSIRQYREEQETFGKDNNRLINVAEKKLISVQKRLDEQKQKIAEATGKRQLEEANALRKSADVAQEAADERTRALARKQADEDLQRALQAEKNRLKEEDAQRRDNDRVVSLWEERFVRLREARLKSEGRNLDVEAGRFDREQEELNQARARLEANGILTAELREQFRQAELDSEVVHKAKLAEIREADLEKEREIARARWQIASDLAGIVAAVTEDGSKAQRAALAVQKAIALKESLVALQVAIAKANAVGFPANIGAIAQATSIGLNAVNTLKGIAHGGLDNVPEEGTYLLNKGERVVKPDQNADLTKFLEEGGGGRVVVNVHNYGDNQVRVEQRGQELEIIVQQVRGALRQDLQRGVGLDNDFRRAYGLTRKGVA